jgi:hypothetical protein
VIDRRNLCCHKCGTFVGWLRVFFQRPLYRFDCDTCNASIRFTLGREFLLFPAVCITAMFTFFILDNLAGDLLNSMFGGFIFISIFMLLNAVSSVFRLVTKVD